MANRLTDCLAQDCSASSVTVVRASQSQQQFMVSWAMDSPAQIVLDVRADFHFEVIHTLGHVLLTERSDLIVRVA